jgi:hypothetical protein
MQFAQSVDARTALRAASVRFKEAARGGREPRFTSALGGIPERDFASKRDRSIDARIGQEERIESAYKASGRVLPTLARRQDWWLARWEPVTIDPGDSERVLMLAKSMPPVLRAEAGSGELGRAPEVVVADVLGTIVDACARRFLSGRFSRRGRHRSRSAVEAWLTGLTGEDPVVRADERDCAALAEQLEDWRQAMERYAAHRTFRTCFRLSTPDEPTAPRTDANRGEPAPGPWRVEILLQAKDDPSVIIPAQEVWRSNGDGLRVLGRRIEDPQERLLGGLGHALRLWPELEPALHGPAPTGVELDVDAAFRFVRDAVPALEQAGFGVLARRRGGVGGCG